MRNPRLDRLSEFPFSRLARKLADVAPASGVDPVDLSIGEPRHDYPELLTRTLAENGHLWGRYPPAVGTPDFREAAGAWLNWRFGLPDGAFDPHSQLLPVAGTKEALYMIAQAFVPESRAGARPAVLMPNPLYSVYFGAAVMCGAEPVLLPATASSGFLPDLDALEPALLERTALFYLCSPGNPQGAAADTTYLQKAVALARRHGFVLAVDECYAEVYYDAPPTSVLRAAWDADGSLSGVIAFHSLSKRSNAAGLRSGFVAGDAALIKTLIRLRSYGAPVQPLPVLAAAAALWRDEEHVEISRGLYQAKLDRAQQVLEGRFCFYRPDGGFFLWLDVGDGEAAMLRLWREAALKALPGAYLAEADSTGANPGAAYIRLALVSDATVTTEALHRFCAVLA